LATSSNMSALLSLFSHWRKPWVIDESKDTIRQIQSQNADHDLPWIILKNRP
jgi:hypothetical protein